MAELRRASSARGERPQLQTRPPLASIESAQRIGLAH